MGFSLFRTSKYRRKIIYNQYKESIRDIRKQLGNTEKSTYIYKNEQGLCSQYTYANDEVNHAVTIVGNNGDGYFWLSYYDKTITLEQTLDFDLSKEELNADGKLIDTTEVSYPYAGYHKFPLSKKHDLRLGEKYSVVVTEEQEYGVISQML